MMISLVKTQHFSWQCNRWQIDVVDTLGKGPERETCLRCDIARGGLTWGPEMKAH